MVSLHNSAPRPTRPAPAPHAAGQPPAGQPAATSIRTRALGRCKSPLAPRTSPPLRAQAALMFVGELLCLLVHLATEGRSRSKSARQRHAELAQRGPAFRAQRLLVFLIPACCDCMGTTLLNVGIYYT